MSGFVAGALLTALLIVGATWFVERWRYRRQLFGEWILLPLWWVPLVILLWLATLWTGLWMGGVMHQAGEVLCVAEGLQIEGLEAIQATDSILMDYTGLRVQDTTP